MNAFRYNRVVSENPLGNEVPAGTGNFELIFLGTRGEIEIRSRRHQRHSSLLVRHDDARIMIDCGADWLNLLPAVAPSAIVLTHAHPDHAWGLAQGAPCPVYATQETSKLLRSFPIRDWRRMPVERALVINGVRFRAYPVQHSIRAPAVGYHVSAAGRSLFYLPDVAWLPNPSHVLQGIDVYIGDGATLTRPLIRRRAGVLIGHATVATQLHWCRKAHVRQAVFSHCGSQIVGGDARRLNALLVRLGRECDVDARFACDGLRMSFPAGTRLQFAQPAKRHA
jgi:phosphoribosyl 1,2-cyclic phosphodiesterase